MKYLKRVAESGHEQDSKQEQRGRAGSGRVRQVLQDDDEAGGDRRPLQKVSPATHAQLHIPQPVLVY